MTTTNNTPVNVYAASEIQEMLNFDTGGFFLGMGEKWIEEIDTGEGWIAALTLWLEEHDTHIIATREHMESEGWQDDEGDWHFDFKHLDRAVAEKEKVVYVIEQLKKQLPDMSHITPCY